MKEAASKGAVTINRLVTSQIEHHTLWLDLRVDSSGDDVGRLDEDVACHDIG